MNDLPPFPGPDPTPFPAARPPQRPEPPQDLRTAVELWWVVAALGAIVLITQMFFSGEMRELMWEMLENQNDALADDARLSESELDSMMTMVKAMATVIGLLLVGAVAGLAWLMRRGKRWARILLTIVAVFLALQALMTFTAVGVGGAAAVVAAVGTILGAVGAVGATVLSYREPVSAYLAHRHPR